ncbi:MAG TPA: glycosyltransferase family 87 protein [Bryobacteraceae bacterium]|nr:glycosyltransferase family 87 protein [Bryobacteraceae bacterium]
MAFRTPLRRALLLLVAAAGIGFWGWRFVRMPRDLSVCTTDFSAFYAGGKLAGTPQTYSPEAVFAAEDRATGCHIDNLIFIKPPFYAVLMWPLAQLPFAAAIFIWRVLGLAALGVFLWLWPGDRLAHLAGCAWFLPVATSFNVGQDVAFVLAAATGAYLLLRKGRFWLAGILFGVCAIKFHLLLLLPLLIVHRRWWRTAMGALATGAVFLAISFAAYGAGWPRRYWTALGDPRLHPYPWNMVNLAGLFRYQWNWAIACAIPVALLCWYLIAAGKLELAVAAVLAGGTLIAPHNTISDGVLFLPLLFWSGQSRFAAARAAAVFALTPFYAFLPSGTLQVVIVMLLAAAGYQTYRALHAGGRTAGITGMSPDGVPRNGAPV